MLRELFRIPLLDWPVYSYGLMLVIGALSASWLARILARRWKLNADLFVNAVLLGLLSGVVGARLSHVLENIGEYFGPGMTLLDSLQKAVNIREGGLTYYGGFLLATPVLIFYARWNKVPIRKGMDIVAPCLMIGLAFGRIGCFLNGCCYGQECSTSAGVSFPYYSDAYLEQARHGEIHPPRQLYVIPPNVSPDDRPVLIPPDLWARPHTNDDRVMRALLEQQRTLDDAQLKALMARQHAQPVLPTEIYSAITSFLLAGLLLAFMTINSVPGRTFALMLLIEPITRFILEMLRVEPAVWHNMSLSMVLAIPQFAGGLLLWFAFTWYHRRTAEPALVPVEARA
jgi:phosphatidylglycerol---prolipoprotein diacylglyceryl transferase